MYYLYLFASQTGKSMVIKGVEDTKNTSLLAQSTYYAEKTKKQNPQKISNFAKQR